MQSNQEKGESVEALREILVTRARGADADEAEHQDLRDVVLRDGELAALAPGWLRQARTLEYWWSYIRPKFPKWDQRTAFVREAFEPMLSHLEGLPDPENPTELVHSEVGVGALVNVEPFGRTASPNAIADLARSSNAEPEPASHPLFERPFAPKPLTPTPRVFLVHGRPPGPRATVEAYLRKLGLDVVVLSDRPNRGATLIEKIEAEGDVAYVVAVVTPDDLGGLYATVTDVKVSPRARENVIFELGYFAGKLGRGRVAALLVHPVELPTDLGGIAYIPMDTSDGWKVKLVRELGAAGIAVDSSRI